jgi:hypothetical protein
MWKVNGTSRSDLRKAILMSYADTDREAEKMASLDYSCPGWEYIDQQNGRRFFNKHPADPNRYVRIREADMTPYFYRGCPDRAYEELNGFTRTQARRLIIQPPPKCKTKDVMKALEFYESAQKLFKGKDKVLARNRYNQMYYLLEERNKKGVDWKNEEKNCPETWLSFLEKREN